MLFVRMIGRTKVFARRRATRDRLLAIFEEVVSNAALTAKAARRFDGDDCFSLGSGSFHTAPRRYRPRRKRR